MRLLKLSTAYNIMVFLTASSDHVSGLASATLTITASKNGGAFGSISPTVTDRGNGWYELALTSSHTDTLGDLALHVTATSADPTDCLMQVVSFDTQDATRLGLSALPNAAAEASGGLITRGTGTGQIAPDGSGNISVGGYASTKNPGGQIKPNSMNDNYVYNASGLMTSCRIRVFASAGALASAVAGHANNTDSEIERFNVTATYNVDGTLASYQYSRAL